MDYIVFAKLRVSCATQLLPVELGTAGVFFFKKNT